MDNYKRIQEINEELLIDGMLLSNQNNIRYISGYAGEGYLYISNSRRIVFTDFRYTFQAELEAKGYEIITIGNGGYVEAINDILRTEGISRLGFEADDMLFSKYEYLKDALEIKEFVPIEDQITRLRRIKTPKELEYMKRAEAIGDEVFTEILSFIKPGMTEIEIAAKIEYLLKVKGAQGLSFNAIVASGINSSMPHAVPCHKKVEMGDFITLDFGCVFEGYCSDMTRTLVLGKASDKQKEVYQVVLEAQEAALAFIKAGYQGKEIDRVARDIINRAGYEGCFGHGLGHSVGLNVHESPRLSMLEEDIIEPGMVVTVEPGVYIKDFGGVRIEDMVAVTETGHDNFTKSIKNLIEL